MVRLRYTLGLGWQIHCGVEVTELNTNKQHIIISARTNKRLHHLADSGWLSVGWISCWTLSVGWWGGKGCAGGMSEDHDCFSMLVLGAFSTVVSNTNALPALTLTTMCGANQTS
jgi:hypothetical protein